MFQQKIYLMFQQKIYLMPMQKKMNMQLSQQLCIQSVLQKANVFNRIRQQIQQKYLYIKSYSLIYYNLFSNNTPMQKEQTIGDLNPRFKKKAPAQYKNSYETNCSTNFYQILLTQDLNTIYQYSVDFEPVLPENSSKVMDKVIKSIIRDLKAKIGFICYKGAMMWGTANLKLALNIKTQITYDNNTQGYQVMLKPCKQISFEDFTKIDQNNSVMMAQVMNIRLKQDLKSLGFKQLDKGKFYKDSDFEKDKLTDAGLSVWRGYSVTVESVNSKLFLKIDPCSRVLRIQNFLQTIKNTRNDDKNMINQIFAGQSIITRYGTHRIQRIQQIVYSMNPKSLFNNTKKQKQSSYIQYYSQNYQIKIKDQKQPLIRIKVRNGLVWQDQYLVPQLVSLTGITDQQRANFHTMKAINQKTKLSVAQRIRDTNTLITLLQGVKQSIFQINKEPLKLKGDVLGAPLIGLYEKDIKPQNGNFQLRDKILDPIHLKNFYFVYSTRGDRDDDDADATMQFLNSASKAYGIKIGKPIFIDIFSQGKLTAKDWINQIEESNKARKQKKMEPIQFAIIYFNQEEKKRKQLYSKIKEYLNNIVQIPSQVITKKTLSNGAKGAISKASKVLLQINDKLGHPLYQINKTHPFWEKNKIAIGALSISSGTKGIIASLVGTRNNEGTLTYSHSQKVQKKEVIPQNVINEGIIGWLKQYFVNSKNTLPDTIVLYRQGLNEKQINKVVEDQIKAFKNAFKTVSSKAKIENYQPNLIYLLVNMRNGTRIYDQFKKGQYGNPLPGTIIGEQLSKDGRYEFLMASTSTTEGTCNMVQYKVLYDSSNQKVPHQALKMMTYEQCYNYPNWTGSIRFPGVLQKANKLSKFQSQNGGQKMSKQNPLRNLDYYI